MNRLWIICLVVLSFSTNATALEQRFHGITMQFTCFDGANLPQINPDGFATCVGKVCNDVDTFGDKHKFLTAGAFVQNSDGTITPFTPLFPGEQTVDVDECRIIAVIVKAKPTDTGSITTNVNVLGVDLGTGQQWNGTWGIGLRVLGTPAVAAKVIK